MAWELTPIDEQWAIWHSQGQGYAISRYDDSVGAWVEPPRGRYRTRAAAVQELRNRGVDIDFSTASVTFDAEWSGDAEEQRINIYWDDELLLDIRARCVEWDENNDPAVYDVFLNGYIFEDDVSPDEVAGVMVEAVDAAFDPAVNTVLEDMKFDDDIIDAVSNAARRARAAIIEQVTRLVS